jgi:hypothetical protein
MVIYLKHPVHGTKVAISDHEAEYDMENGWVKFDPSEKIEQPVAKQDSVSEIPEEPKPKRRRKIA